MHNCYFSVVEDTMEGIQSGSKKKGRRNKKGRKLVARMDIQ